MSEIWYRMTKYGTEPTAVEVESSTKSMVKPVGLKRCCMTTTWDCHRRTRRECWQWLVDVRRAELGAAQARVTFAQDNCTRIEGELADAIAKLGECDE